MCIYGDGNVKVIAKGDDRRFKLNCQNKEVGWNWRRSFWKVFYKTRKQQGYWTQFQVIKVPEGKLS